MASDSFIQLLDESFPLELKQIAAAEASFIISEYDRRLFSKYEIDFPAELNKAVPKRCAEFLAGRYVARHALEQLSGTAYQIPAAPDRSPIWPQGIIGSISHTNTQALAMVAYARDHLLLGLDLENWMEPVLARELSDQIICPQERKLLADSELEFHQGLTLIFSAKESLYKALFPQVKRFFGFEYARVNKIDPDSGTFVISLTRTLTQAYPAGWQISGRYLRTADTVLTLVSD
ncbi:4'-phosphopantetheinyl transferase family protein [Dongshaea marina]|uniref:4'-phosphopantetheinyl transferase family protein n=1 Tax=Dongshaea marina TaxID=2047966 RepID=UPI000D3E2945|nr:4'-phosphopantetheinyl transferase superfamily protein [Dongshaea marina]